MNSQPTVLLVDDEEKILYILELLIRSAGIAQVITLADSRKVMPLLKKQDVSVIVLDLAMPFINGRELLVKITQEYPGIPVIIMTGEGQLKTAVQCIKNGAFDYLVKPEDEEHILATIQKALEVRALKAEVLALKEQLFSSKLECPEVYADIITESREMKKLFQYLESIAASTQPVLITGETGVGKELFALAVHKLSNRSGQYIAVNVAGLDDTAFSDTLFGHAKGAYTGADTRREGMIVRASEGTLFLDEIGDLKDSLQVKILRLLQDQSYYPLGSDVPVRSRARVVVATNHDLAEEMTSGRFRKDLYYRLRFHHVHIPPLRERKADIPLLLDYFVQEAAASLGKKPPPIPIEMYPLLKSYHFPGNVRELKAMVYDAVAQHVGGALSLSCFRQLIRLGALDSGKSASVMSGETFAELNLHARLPTFKEAEEYLTKEALLRAKGNQGIAAAMLGVNRSAFNKRLQKNKK